jgi:hypothetical protein
MTEEEKLKQKLNAQWWAQQPGRYDAVGKCIKKSRRKTNGKSKRFNDR